MDDLHKKILNLELGVSQVGQYPPQLMSCLKFKKLFSEDDPKVLVESRKREIRQIKSVLEGYLSWDRDFEHALAEARSIADGNASYFDDLITQYGIDEDEVNAVLGPKDEDADSIADQPLAREDCPDDEEDTFELKKNNLHEFSRFNDYDQRQRSDSPL